jgi:hypothetical protein
VVLASCLLELSDEVLHVLALSIQLFDRFWVFPFLILDFLSSRLHESIEQVHQPIDVLLLVFFLDKLVDFGREVGDGPVVSPRLCFFLVELLFKQLFFVFSLENFLL